MKIVTNYHTHSTFTDGSEDVESIIKKAITVGFKEIGFTDHAAYITDAKIEKYITLIEQLKLKYKNKISIMLGLECEFPTNVYGIDLNKYINRLDYILFGNHFCFCYHELYQGVFKQFLSKEQHDLFYESALGKKHFNYGCKLYYKNLKMAIKNNKLMYFAHPDIYTRFYSKWNKNLNKLTHKICKLCEKKNIIFEINVKQVIRYGMIKEFWEIVKQYNIETIVGLDYHTPKHGAFESVLPDIVANFIKEMDFHPLNVKD